VIASKMLCSFKRLPHVLRGIRQFSTVQGKTVPVSEVTKFVLSADTAAVSEISAVNWRLQNLQLTANYLSGKPLLELPTANTPNIVQCPTVSSVSAKNFIIEDKKNVVREPQQDKPKVEEPKSEKIVKKYAIRMIVLRRRKMKKHQLKKLRKRMKLVFKADYVQREKAKELIFRSRLASKVTAARKFSAEEFVTNYLEEFHKELIPKTYDGKRLPEWLIRELIEKDRLDAKEAALAGKDVTTEETIVKPGETVQQFIQRMWK